VRECTRFSPIPGKIVIPPCFGFVSIPSYFCVRFGVSFAGGGHIVQDKFNRNIQSAKSIMQALPSQAIPADLADTHLFVKVCDVVGYQERLDDGNLRDVATTVESGYESCSSMIKASYGEVLWQVARTSETDGASREVIHIISASCTTEIS